mmetsp:Transcript_55291/g.131867  ORF Transcript_55291/g.131867 Transcript_55291/m.131867 type:complete len:201 (-) Transcript_55291:40-642(-)
MPVKSIPGTYRTRSPSSPLLLNLSKRKLPTTSSPGALMNGSVSLRNVAGSVKMSPVLPSNADSHASTSRDSGCTSSAHAAALSSIATASSPARSAELRKRVLTPRIVDFRSQALNKRRRLPCPRAVHTATKAAAGNTAALPLDCPVAHAVALGDVPKVWPRLFRSAATWVPRLLAKTKVEGTISAMCLENVGLAKIPLQA